jgi:23S rRNA (guanosine2251-2'-O)-methyltransferase
MARLIYGLQPVREAVRIHGARLRRVLAEVDNPTADALARFAADQGARPERVARATLDRLTHNGRHQGVAAFGPELVVHGLEGFRLEHDTPLLVLDGVTDPQNFGAAIRSAVALGSGAVLWAEHHSAPLTPATFRASAGAVEHARLLRTTSVRTAIGRLHEVGVSTVLLDAGATTPLEQLDLSGRTAVVIGAEDLGVSRAVRRACLHQAHLAMSGAVGSLNASVAAAVALYEVRRQLRARLAAEA